MDIPNEKRICIGGYGRHGKDFLAEILDRITHLRYGGSTSWAALPYVAQVLGVHPQVAWETRHSNRQFWFDYCNHLRKDNPCFLIEKVLEQGDMVVGLRDKAEIDALKERGLVGTYIWVEAWPRVITGDATVPFGPED